MKKHHLLLMIIPLVWSANELDAQPTTSVNTPNGNQVVVLIQGEGTNDELADLENAAAQWRSGYGNGQVNIVGSATIKYNCHSYAWYKTAGGTIHT